MKKRGRERERRGAGERKGERPRRSGREKEGEGRAYLPRVIGSKGVTVRIREVDCKLSFEGGGKPCAQRISKILTEHQHWEWIVPEIIISKEERRRGRRGN